MKKRILSLILLASMLISLAACGGDSGNDGKDPSDSTNTPDENLPAGIESKDYGNATVNFFMPEWGRYKDCLFVEENDGEAFSSALYNREIKVEDYLGVDITHQFNEGSSKLYMSMLQNSFSGDNLYQVALTHCIYDTVNLIGDGLVCDLAEIDTINLDADWWNHNSNENLAINGKQFYAINDFMIPDPNAIMFNKTMLDEYKLEDPYQLVKDGKWTIDKMMEMASHVTQENNDGVRDNKDIYGMAFPSQWLLISFTHGFGLTLVDKDEDGYLKFNMDSPKAYDVAEKFEQLFSSPDTFVYRYSTDFPGEGGYDPTQSLNISHGRSLFGITALNNLAAFRDSSVEFGILPYPKFDEEQEDYISLDWSGLMCMPSAVPEEDRNMVGETIELLAYYADAAVLPAYYDVVLDYKLTRDKEDREMLDYIFDSILYDAGMNYFGFHSNMKKFWNLPDEVRADNWAGFSSFLAAYKTGAEIEIESFNEIIADLSE